VAELKLDLLQFASGSVTQAWKGPTKVGGARVSTTLRRHLP